MTIESVDVLVVGAGISGIGAGYHLQTYCPGKSYLILEGRADLGGTWDLFRYPGIRSDSDMHTLGFSFRPWKEAKAIADGPSIKKYLAETAPRGIRRPRGGPSRSRAAPIRPSSPTRPISCSCAAAITTTPKASRRN